MANERDAPVLSVSEFVPLLLDCERLFQYVCAYGGAPADSEVAIESDSDPGAIMPPAPLVTK